MKTVNCIEAIKANRDGKRIRIVGTDAWIVPKFFCGRVALTTTECLSEWEIEDEPLVLWVVALKEGTPKDPIYGVFKDKESAMMAHPEWFDITKCIKMVEVRDE